MARRGKKTKPPVPDGPVSFRDRLGLATLIALTVFMIGWTVGIPIYELVRALF